MYMRLSADDQKDEKQISAELLKEFERGKLNREEALHELATRSRKTDESPLTLSHKFVELVKLAYPDFEESVRLTIAKDYFIRSLHPDMQVALKSMEKFSTLRMDQLATETTRLQLAGINSFPRDKRTSDINNIQLNAVDITEDNSEACSLNDTLVESIAVKVFEKFNETSLQQNTERGDKSNVKVDYVQSNNKSNKYYNQRTGYRSQNNMRGRGRSNNKTNLKCRSCQSTSHLVRECPTRFCQACGGRGHDAWNPACPNFQ